MIFKFDALGIIEIVIFGLLILASLFAFIWKWVLLAKYSKYRKAKTSSGLTARQTAENMLKQLGLDNVKVVKCNFFASIFLGNSYSPIKKIIRLRKNIIDSNSITSIAVATQKVALAKRDADGDKKLKARSILMGFGYFAPFAVVPCVIIGVLIDIFITNRIGTFTIVFTSIAFVYFILAFIVLILNIPIEKKGCEMALEYIKEFNLLSEEEQETAKVLFKTYMANYVLDFVTELLYIIWEIIQIVLEVREGGK